VRCGRRNERERGREGEGEREREREREGECACPCFLQGPVMPQLLDFLHCQIGFHVHPLPSLLLLPSTGDGVESWGHVVCGCLHLDDELLSSDQNKQQKTEKRRKYLLIFLTDRCHKLAASASQHF
jgi:hypothetical protein